MCELSGCDPKALTDVDAVHAMMIRAAKDAKATIMESAFHRFEPQGVSGTVILAESHLSIHTWPEHGAANIDLLTCGRLNGDHMIDHLRQALEPVRCNITRVIRDVL